ncbi:hypothetical protein HFN01_34590 [Rhizobium leguminosarum]|uniref:hypothetical protein n=1 Tax=Rhizobium leguminosarum TaxID=384 RepID=UPI001C959CB5|nr:hypothetical protein [Rhizobium leguminosarum]MBY5399919.1 hypothetical protein [Rhizobium leguminosarum]
MADNDDSLPGTFLRSVRTLTSSIRDLRHERTLRRVEYSKDELQHSNQIRVEELTHLIPAQNPLIRFGPSEDGKFRLAPGLPDQNDFDSIEALRQEMFPPIATLNHRYSLNPNAPQASLFRPILSRYQDELRKDPGEINYAVLFARGARLYAARITAEREVRSGEWPELEASESAAIDAICDLHGPLIMASAVGRRLVTDARQYVSTLEEEREEDTLLKAFGEALAEETEIFEEETSDAIVDLTAPIPDDPQRHRSRGVRLLVVSSALVTIVGGLAYATAGVGGLAIVGLGSKSLFEVLKKMDSFKTATDNLAKAADDLEQKAVNMTERQARLLLQHMAKFVERRHDLLAKITSLRPEFGWAKNVLAQPELALEESPAALEPAAPVATARSQSIMVFNRYPKTVRPSPGRLLATKLRLPYLNLAAEMHKISGMSVRQLRTQHGDKEISIMAGTTFEDLLKSYEPKVFEFSETDLFPSLALALNGKVIGIDIGTPHSHSILPAVNGFLRGTAPKNGFNAVIETLAGEIRQMRDRQSK